MAAINLRVPNGLVPLTNQQVDDNFQNLNNALGAAGGTTIPTQTGTGGPVLSISPFVTGTLTAENITYTGGIVGGTSVIAIATNQIYKDVSGNVGLGNVPSGSYKLEVTGNISYTGTLTGSTGIIAIGTNQIYKDASGNVGLGNTPSGTYKLQVTGSIAASSQLVSTVATGTAPLAVTSTTNVANLNASTLSGATFAAPGPVGSGTASTGAFTTLSASSTVSGTGFTNYMASPPAIGGTTPAAITGSNLMSSGGLWVKDNYTGTTFTNGVMVDYNVGTGRISVGSSTGLAFYTGGLANTLLMSMISTGQVGIGGTPSAVKLEVISTDAMLIPKGTQLQRPTGVAGYIRYNTTTSLHEGHNGTTWLPFVVNTSGTADDAGTAVALAIALG